MVTTGNRIRMLAVVTVALGITLITMIGDPNIDVAYHVTSPDKKIEIRMPDESIPPEVEILDIAMVPVPGGYALRPENLQLAGPVTISIAVAMQNGTAQIPRFTLHTDEQSYEPVDIRVRRHHDVQKAVIEVDTENFRRIELH